MTFLASSGDDGSTGSTKAPIGKGGTTLPTPEVGWPSSDPLVTAVGGTNLCTDVVTGKTVDSTHGPADCQGAPGSARPPGTAPEAGSARCSPARRTRTSSRPAPHRSRRARAASRTSR